LNADFTKEIAWEPKISDRNFMGKPKDKLKKTGHELQEFMPKLANFLKMPRLRRFAE
jgi:hypothetical protein